ncbi:hypothetical protein HDV57DRAFT_495406 [Trichoderma longibrachiatum]|uniref:Aflatoxin regulatory protein domain-containing protein n=1 Tax=Trichoderma longibrachiatum ATCC 18648 TaxID=983965 RepID=A0A2T4C633_TRILO|nr:hypothetical protein M440DRAFT_1401364 [Trichoderma longibrachiatum ATCC 18648]
MDTTDAYDRGNSLPPPDASMDDYLDVESFVTSVADLLTPPDLNAFNFESKDLSPKWLNDVFSITPRSTTEFVPPSTAEISDNLSPPQPKATSSEIHKCRNPQGLCLSLATGLLKSMHSCSPSCLLGLGMGSSQQGEPPLSRAVDNVLSTNYEALRAVRGFLRCPCYESPQLQLLVTVMCAEAIAWYWRIIDTYSSRCGNSSSMDSSVQLAERVEMSRRSFFIGDQCLESRLEASLIGQVVASRLQELEDLIGDISWNMEQSAAKITDEARGHPAYSAVHIRMDAFLNTQLAAVRRELLKLRDDSQGLHEENTGQRYAHESPSR